MKIDYDKNKLAKVAKDFGLKFIILHGSFANGVPDKESDLDIAALAHTPLDFKKELQLYGTLNDVFHLPPQTDLDFKTLNKVDPLFRYEVTRGGILLYGDPTEYEEYKAFAFRSYYDSRPLLDLEHHLIKKFQTHLNSLYVK
ncbi:MAG: nucleotidyltransferase domain-containing protein [Patescibacteria group bacterium]